MSSEQTAKQRLDKGYIKAYNFKSSKNKPAYLYKLTPTCIAAKNSAAKRFLVRKQTEYEQLRREIHESVDGR